MNLNDLPHNDRLALMGLGGGERAGLGSVVRGAADTRAAFSSERIGELRRAGAFTWAADDMRVSACG
jgi:hypothetical protein